MWLVWHVGKARTKCFGGLYNFYCYMAETLNTGEENLAKRATTGKNRKRYGDCLVILAGNVVGMPRVSPK